LKEKAELHEYFGVIGKRVEGKENLGREGYRCYDLEDII
jgi:hypothetical protein